mmetsp:Transcript_26990/g.39470  ORF Transcript_26990/g.39470 Transcript_26990/m.39470 type:complete len:195 (-) Transcript_26990:155-739(-)
MSSRFTIREASYRPDTHCTHCDRDLNKADDQYDICGECEAVICEQCYEDEGRALLCKLCWGRENLNGTLSFFCCRDCASYCKECGNDHVYHSCCLAEHHYKDCNKKTRHQRVLAAATHAIETKREEINSIRNRVAYLQAKEALLGEELLELEAKKAAAERIVKGPFLEEKEDRHVLDSLKHRLKVRRKPPKGHF